MTYAPEKGLVPRGVTCSTRDVNTVKIIVVGKNPGNPDDLEKDRYGVSSEINGSEAEKATAMFEAASQWTREAYLAWQDGKRHPYQTHLMRFLRKALNTSKDEEVLVKVYFTELLKCTDENDESPNLFDKEHLEKTKKCMNRWLLEELDLFPQAKVIVALGHEVEIALMSWRKLPVVYLRHPRAYTKSQSQTALKTIRIILQH